MFEETQIKVNISENLYFPLADAFGEIINSARLQRYFTWAHVRSPNVDVRYNEKKSYFWGFRLKSLYHAEVSQSAYLGYLIIFFRIKTFKFVKAPSFR